MRLSPGFESNSAASYFGIFILCNEGNYDQRRCFSSGEFNINDAIRAYADEHK